MRKAKARRSYDASGRRRRAVEAQARMLAVARHLFAERGYAETTMEAIADAAEVAVPTVYAAFGSKRGVLSRVLYALVSDDPEGSSVLRTAGAREVLAEPDPRRALRLFATGIDGILERVGPINEVMRHAARAEPDVAETYQASQDTRLANMTAVARRLGELGLREGLSVDEAARTIWVLTSWEVRQLLLRQAGVSAQDYRTWLADTLIAALLPPPPKRRTPR